MANLPEEPTFDEGVYQIELTDPVIGGPNGISNRPIRNLANRTKWLKNQVDALDTRKAPLLSPEFTGQPKSPTPADSDNTTIVANTSWVRRVIGLLAAPKAHAGAGGNAHQVATREQAGFMSPSDKQKLDSIDSGAQVNAVTRVAGKTGDVALEVGDVRGAAPAENATLSGTTRVNGTIIFDPAGDARGRTWPATDNSISFATTAWVRNAMADIASKAGFLYWIGGWTGYVRLPSWLGGVTVQWSRLTGASDSLTFTYPIVFPNTHWTAMGCPFMGSAYRFAVGEPSRTSVQVAFLERGAASVACWVWVIGR